MRLIYADDISRRLERVIRVGAKASNGEHPISAECVLSVLKSLPNVDAVEVVRCKDCRHWSGRKYNVHINGFLPWCGFSALQREANDYCSYGERKDGEQP